MTTHAIGLSILAIFFVSLARAQDKPSFASASIRIDQATAQSGSLSPIPQA